MNYIPSAQEGIIIESDNNKTDIELIIFVHFLFRSILIWSTCVYLSVLVLQNFVRSYTFQVSKIFELTSSYVLFNVHILGF